MNLIFCSIHIYHFMEDYILSIISKIYGQYSHIESVEFNPEFEFENTNNYIFIQNIPEYLINKISFTNVYLLNTEQLCDISNLNRVLNNLSKNNLLNFIDYSNTNINYINSLIFNKKFFFPYQINLNDFFNLKKNKDICFVGDCTKYRRNIINLLKDKNITLDLISRFGKERDNEVFQYKILLNISQSYDHTVFESIRCDRCIYNKMIVISDFKENMEEYYLKDYIIFEKYENIPDKVIDVLTNYDYYYNKLYKDFNIDNISLKIDELSKEIIETLQK